MRQKCFERRLIKKTKTTNIYFNKLFESYSLKLALNLFLSSGAEKKSTLIPLLYAPIVTLKTTIGLERVWNQKKRQ